MANGALHGGVCYAEQGKALDAYYSAALPAQSMDGVGFLGIFEKVGDVWHWSKYQMGGGLAAQQVAPVITFPACDPLESFHDGMQLGWGVTAAMVAAWCIANMRRGL